MAHTEKQRLLTDWPSCFGEIVAFGDIKSGEITSAINKHHANLMLANGGDIRFKNGLIPYDDCSGIWLWFLGEKKEFARRFVPWGMELTTKVVDVCKVVTSIDENGDWLIRLELYPSADAVSYFIVWDRSRVTA